MNFCSIIMTHFAMDENRSNTMQNSIISLVENTEYPAEIIVVDNGKSRADTLFLLDLVRKRKINAYVANAENMHFGYARNQGLAIANGGYISIVDNDIKYEKGWMKECIKVLETYPDEKIYAAPFCDKAHLPAKYWNGELEVEGKIYRKNMRAGSNCFVIRRDRMEEIGRFMCHRVAGTKWTNNAVRLGYLCAVTPERMALDMGFRKGYNTNASIPVKQVLTSGVEVYFNSDEFTVANPNSDYREQGKFK